MIERTLILLKPDGIMRQFVGEIITRLEKAGFKIVAMKMLWQDKDFFEKHYHDVEERHGREILDMNLKAMTVGPVIAITLEGEDAIAGVKKMVGPEIEPKKCPPGTIRGDYSHQNFRVSDESKIAVRNIIHCSTSEEDAERELNLWFKPEELHSYKTVHEAHVF